MSGPEEAVVGSCSGPVTILIAETDRIVRWAIAETLKHAGYATTEVCTAAEALAVLEGPAPVGMLITGRSIVGGGVALAHLVHHGWPSIGIIVTSAIGRHHRYDLPPGTRLLGKPYMFSDIVREVESGLASVREWASACAQTHDPLVSLMTSVGTVPYSADGIVA
ncbi:MULTISPECIES: response regulator [Methylobacterium]|uniref:response regulator n=1 Tax=Methylobacterium TaxID=407 RepID=UPI0011CAEE92|nr:MULTISPECIES: response regulator [Methylobacterium]TXN81515.1 response regulator [Methylobacterium sp. WL8]